MKHNIYLAQFSCVLEPGKQMFMPYAVACVWSYAQTHIDIKEKYELKEIVKGDSIFCATGITSSEVLSGIHIKGNRYNSETLVTHKNTNFREILKRSNILEE